MKYLSVPIEGDPSKIHQLFFSLSIKLICCRYWHLTKWESKNMSFPYWRLYWNKNVGAEISYKEQVFPLSPDHLYLIAPSTPFSSSFKSETSRKSDYLLQGERITSEDKESEIILKNRVLHLFIHFNLGLPFDSVSPGIYSIPVHSALLAKLERITAFLPKNYEIFTFNQNLDIHTLIFEALSEVPDTIWNSVILDKRILYVLEKIEKGIVGNLSNPLLAEYAGMALNSFIRKFTSEVGTSPQSFVQQKRIERAEISLQYSDEKIDQIAINCGYKDRFYFSRAFKILKNISPGAYRKRYQH